MEQREVKLCPRTKCGYRTGEPMPGVVCVYSYTGSVPCTGPQRCLTCGELKPTDNNASS